MTDESTKAIRDIITLEPGLLAVPPDSMYVTEDELIFGAHNVDLDDIEDIEIIDHKPRDWLAVGAISVHVFTGLILAYTLSVPLFWAANIVIFAGLLGWSIVKIVRKTPYAYISIRTSDSEYQFGVATAIDAANLFAAVAPHLDRDLRYNDFVAD